MSKSTCLPLRVNTPSRRVKSPDSDSITICTDSVNTRWRPLVRQGACVRFLHFKTEELPRHDQNGPHTSSGATKSAKAAFEGS
eukprot:2717889-Rhodomonas_salina.1